MQKKGLDTQAHSKTPATEEAVDRSAERETQRDGASSSENVWTKLAASPQDPGLPNHHAQLFNCAKASGTHQTQQLLNNLQRNYGNYHVQRVLHIARKSAGDSDVHPEIEQTISRKRSGGQALDRGVRTQMESAMGVNFGGVRVHTDGEADHLNRELNARAFTTGQDVFFRSGEYRPGTSGGRELLAHELTHVVQQTGGLQRKMTLGQAGDKYEQEADRVADQVMRMPEPHVQRQPLEDEEDLIQTKPNESLQRQADTEAEEEEEKEAKKTEEEESLQTRAHHGKSPSVSDSLEAKLNNVSVQGETMPDSTRTFFEPRFGHDFGHVRIPEIAATKTPENAKTEVGTTLESAIAVPETITTPGETAVASTEAETISSEYAAEAETPAIAEKAPEEKVAEAPAGIEAPAGAPTPPTEGAAAEAAPSEANAGAPAEVVSITAEDPGGILEQLAEVPPSSAFSAYSQAESVSASALENQKNDLQATLPEIPAPTGLEPKEKRDDEKRTTKATKPSPESLKGEKTGREGEPYDTRVPEAPPAPTPRATNLRGSSEEGSPEANAELARSARGSLNSVGFSANQISTHSGSRSGVDLTGEADPSQMAAFNNQSNQEVLESKTEAEKDIYVEHGENAIYPEPTNETLKSNMELTAQPPATVPGGEAPILTPDVATGLDASLGPVLKQRIGEKSDEYAAGKTKSDSDVSNARQEADTEIADQKDEARENQLNEQKKTQDEVAGFKQEWQEEIDGVTDEYKEKADKASTEQGRKISEEKQKTEKKANKHLDDAEKKATKEKKKAAKKAQEEKQKTKKKSGGFWGWVKSKASALIDGLKAAVNAIYDGLRAAVKGIFELAKTLYQGVIELGRMLIVGLIKGFGMILKGLVSVVFVAFPKIAKDINKKIDAAVNTAVEVVNKVAQVLKDVVAAILDFLANVVDSVLGFIQSLYNGLFTLIGMLIRGEFQAIFEGIGNLVDAAKQMPDHFWGQATEELIGMDTGEPLPIERSAPPKPEESAEVALEAGTLPAEDIALLNRPVLGENDVAVDNVPTEELDPEFIASTNLKEGEELVFGESTDPSRSIEAIKAEMMGAPEAPSITPSEEEGTAAGTEATLTQEQIAEKELQELMAREPEGGCTKEKSAEPAKGNEVPEAMKIGPLTPGQRARYLLHQMKQGISQWFSCNWPWLLAGAVAALVGFIALNIVTGGAILAALPLIMQIVGAIMVGVALARVVSYVGDYLSQGWAGSIVTAAKSLARGLAVGAIELIFALLFNAGAVIKALKGGIKGAAKAAAQAAKATVKTTLKSVKELGKLGVKAGKATLKNGKLFFKGLKSGFSKGVKSLDDMAKRLWKRLRFKKFKIRIKNRRFQLLGYINPWILLSNGDIEWVDELTKKGKIGEKVKGKTSTGKLIEGFRVGGSKAKPDYRNIADVFLRETVSDANVIHHAIEQQVLKRFPKLFSIAEINAAKNLRAILKGAFNSEVHLSKIRILWNDFYTAFKGIDLPVSKAREAFLRFRSHVDDYIKAMEKFMSTDKEVAKALANGNKTKVRELLLIESEKLLKSSGLSPAKGIKNAFDGLI